MKGTRPPLAGAPRQCLRNSFCRILVVDEDSDLLQLYAEALAGIGYCVDAAKDGAAAWEALRSRRYNLLITEHEMPHLTGVELVKLLRGARMALPVVMAAGRMPTYELARNPTLQLAATLSKPFAVDALLDTVQNVLRAHDTAREQIKPLPVSGKASRQPLPYGCEDFNPDSRTRLTINNSATAFGEVVKISHRVNPQ